MVPSNSPEQVSCMDVQGRKASIARQCRFCRCERSVNLSQANQRVGQSCAWPHRVWRQSDSLPEALGSLLWSIEQHKHMPETVA